MAAVAPTGTVTLLFTDIEGSTALLHALGDRYGDVLAEHRDVVRAALARHGGFEVDASGDAFFAAFARPGDALAAARAIQAGLAAHPWPADGEPRVRIGLHTGTPEWRPPSYVGLDVHRAARVMAAAHGGQVLVSGVTAALLGADAGLRDLGEHRLKDLPGPVRLWQGGDGEFPPVRSLGVARLPVPPTALVGREAEVAAGVEALRSGTRLLTLTGPGGAGKTRLALEIAARAAAAFPDGAVFADLSRVGAAEGVPAALAAVLPGPPAETLAAQAGGRRVLLVADNFEHVAEAAPVVAELLAGAPGMTVLATSRSPLRLRGEVDRPVAPLAPAPARELLRERLRDRGAEAGDEAALDAICRLVEGLPLALELAAARVPLLGAAALAERLHGRLDLLTGGPRDAPERQRTMRATVEWSHRLLDEDGRRVFRRLAVFAGGADLESAEAVCGPGTGAAVEALVEASLMRRVEAPAGPPRVAMLETLRAYAAERLAADDDPAAAAGRHARRFLALAGTMAPDQYTSGQPVMRRRLALEIDNFRAAHDHLLGTDPAAALALIGGVVWSHWELVGPLAEGRRRLAQTLERAPADAPAHGPARFAAARLAMLAGEPRAALPDLEAAAGALEASPNVQLRANVLAHRGAAHYMLGDVPRGRAGYEEALLLARRSGDDWSIAMVLNNIADELSLEHPHVARRMLEESLDHRRRSGDPRGQLFTAGILAELELAVGNHAAAEALARDVSEQALGLGDLGVAGWAGAQLAAAALLTGDETLARVRLADALALHVDDVRTQATLLTIAGALGGRRDPQAAAEAWALADAHLRRAGRDAWPYEQRIRAAAEPAVRAALGGRDGTGAAPRAAEALLRALVGA